MLESSFYFQIRQPIKYTCSFLGNLELVYIVHYIMGGGAGNKRVNLLRVSNTGSILRHTNCMKLDSGLMGGNI